MSFVRNFYLEYDESDDEDGPYLGFFVQTTLVGLVSAVVIYLCGQLVLGAAYPDEVLSQISPLALPRQDTGLADASALSAWALSACFACAAAVTFVSCAASVIYLKILFWRDEHDRNTSGTALNVSALLIACVLYSAASTLAIFWLLA